MAMAPPGLDCIPMPMLGGADLTLLRRVLRKMDRWYTPATEASAPQPRSVQVAPQTNALGVPASVRNINRVGLMMFAPSNAVNLYVNFTREFGAINNSIPQYGMPFAASVYLAFGQEYCGDIWLINCAAAGQPVLDVRVIELFADLSLFA